VVDIGGGSTEFVLGDPSDDRAGGIEAAISVDVGCVRMTERHLRSDPPTPAELAAATADVEAALDRVAGTIDLTRPRALIGLAGSVTTVTAHALQLPGYDSGRIHGARLPVGEVAVACTELILAGRAERAAMPFMHPGRVDVIGAGALVWSLVVGRVARASGVTEVLTSEHDILDGIAWSLG
jgi:exopolyphosphatase/guanosine-5'-triphosphate,3'-diphosphate pyrophosphatase